MLYRICFLCLWNVYLFGIDNIFAQSDKQTQMEDLKLESFSLGLQINSYPDFVRVDSVPKNTLLEASLRLPGGMYYMHKDVSRFHLVNEPVLYLIVTTNLKAEIIAVSAVCYYNESILSRLNQVYGHWQAASSIGSEDDQTPEQNANPLYIWKYKDDVFNLHINRYNTIRNRVKQVDDYVIFSYQVKDYHERLIGK